MVCLLAINDAECPALVVFNRLCLVCQHLKAVLSYSACSMQFPINEQNSYLFLHSRPYNFAFKVMSLSILNPGVCCFAKACLYGLSTQKVQVTKANGKFANKGTSEHIDFVVRELKNKLGYEIDRNEVKVRLPALQLKFKKWAKTNSKEKNEFLNQHTEVIWNKQTPAEIKKHTLYDCKMCHGDHLTSILSPPPSKQLQTAHRNNDRIIIEVKCVKQKPNPQT